MILVMQIVVTRTSPDVNTIGRRRVFYLVESEKAQKVLKNKNLLEIFWGLKLQSFAKKSSVSSKIRCRIEHVFGEMKMRMGDETLLTIGFARAKFWIGMRNLAYNMSRLIRLTKPKKQKAQP